MVKTLDAESTYEPSRRSRNWLKVKKDYLETEGGVGDSLDLVVIGAYHGRGKRTGGYGGFLLACYNPETESYEALCKLGTGFSEQDLIDFTAQLKGQTIAAPLPYYLVTDGIKPDVWFYPECVWEVKAADLSLSPIYTAAMGEVGGDGRGVSLRFPRFIRVRQDKSPTDATTSDEVAQFYRSQSSVKHNQAMIDEDY